MSTSPTGPTAYPLPQPSTSGSLDLSNIKPVNSGSVSLADAIARARGIAAEKGVSYDAGRGGGSTWLRNSTTSSMLTLLQTNVPDR